MDISKVSAQVILPRILQIGGGASCELSSVLKSLKCQRPLIVTDTTMVALGYVQRIQDQLSNVGIETEIFDQTVPEPTTASILAGVDLVRNGDFDCIVALGGGSPIDSAKAMSVVGKVGGQMCDFKVPRIVDELGLPVIAIPTTAGTGSEATRFTVITDDQTDEKMLCVGKGFMPVAALVDYELTMSLPVRTTADTGIDALTHAIEAYVSNKATPFSDIQALAAMRLIAPNLRRVYCDGSDVVAREKIMLGATLAGIAFSNASVALVHGMSRPIGALFHVPHGLSNAMLLPSVTAYSISAAPERYAKCAEEMGVVTKSNNREAKNNALIEELEALNKDLEVPSLTEFGVEKDQFFKAIPTMAEQAIASGSPANNPRIPTIEEMVLIYEKLWDE